MVEGSEIFIPLEEIIDLEKEQKRTEKEIDRLEGFLKSINGKLNNEQFVKNAPDDVVKRERDKRQDTENSLQKLKDILKELE